MGNMASNSPFRSWAHALRPTPFKVLLSKRLYAPDSIEESGERRSGKPLLSDLRSMRRRA
jgi:hypothetical protein